MHTLTPSPPLSLVLSFSEGAVTPLEHKALEAQSCVPPYEQNGSTLLTGLLVGVAMCA